MIVKPEFAHSLHRLLISLFIISYLTLVFIWLLLNSPYAIFFKNPAYKQMRSLVVSAVILTGIEQNWHLFSPAVKQSNSYTLVVTAFQNGLLKLSEFPRMEKLNCLEKWQQEKFRKLFVDNFPYSNYALLRPAVSRFLARSYYQPGNLPVRISYFLISSPIPPPKPFLAINKESSQAKIDNYIENYYVYGVAANGF